MQLKAIEYVSLQRNEEANAKLAYLAPGTIRTTSGAHSSPRNTIFDQCIQQAWASIVHPVNSAGELPAILPYTVLPQLPPVYLLKA